MLGTHFPPPAITTSLDSFALGWLYPYAMHWKAPVTLATLFLLFVARVNPEKSAADAKPAAWFKWAVVAHNVVLAAFSAWMHVAMVGGLVANLRAHGWYSGICDLKLTMWNDTLFRVSFYFYLSKYYEFVDTLIILYKGRRVSVLQAYHHAGAVLTMWAGCYYMAVPIAFFVIANSAIHAWMYVFYALTTCGIRPPGKRLLTSSQIFQFLFGISCCLFYTFCPGCQTDHQKIAIYINLAYLFPLLGLFVSFFAKTYLRRPAAAAADPASKKDLAAFHSSGAQRVAQRVNHYAVLGVAPGATASEIKSAFYRCSMQWHPDRNPGADDAHRQFLKISEAYSVLGNEQKRHAYDRALRIRTASSGYGGARHSTAFSSSGEYSSVRRPPSTGYQRPEGTYARYTSPGQRPRSNFAEWERQHYWATKERAEGIRRDAQRSRATSRYTDLQISVVQFWELVVVFGVVFGAAWSLSGLVRPERSRTPQPRSSAPP
ncbi:hypothetical protein H4R18_000487 [Coemansia javaensis]|uniref:Elongation of fatty acids protein n=1 Tax=Coemansia javaensis TaxID=2761396 RepID=A0A9W8HL35_9FUNG|nr:hypothetical protein H4R18_000487 [Coemansia javaensis]